MPAVGPGGQVIESKAHRYDIGVKVQRLIDPLCDVRMLAASVGPQYFHVQEINLRGNPAEDLVTRGDRPGTMRAVFTW